MGVKLRERPGKGWGVFIDFQGKRKAKFFGKDKHRAEVFVKKMEAELELAKGGGTPVSLTAKEEREENIPMVKEYLEEWRDTHAIVHCKPSTYRGYARAIEQHLIPSFCSCPLNRLEREQVRHFIAKLMKQGKARGTIENCLVPLKAIYYQAMDDGEVTFNPVARLGKIFNSRKDRSASVEALSLEEVALLLRIAKSRFPALYPVILCAVRTGMRQGELVGLKWGDIDFHGGFIEVRQGVVLRQETSTKTHKIRRIDLSHQLQKTIQEMKEVRELRAMSEGTEMAPWVFLSPGGKRWDDRHLRRAWQRCVNAAGLRHTRFHNLRHSYATAMLEKGAPSKYVQNQLGHSSIQITLDVYSHAFQRRSREWVNRIDEPVDKSAGGAESANFPQPRKEGLEHGTHKSLINLVAVEGFEPPARGL